MTEFMQTKRAKEDFRSVDSYYLALRRLNNLFGKRKEDIYVFEIIGKALHLGSGVTVRESEENYKKGGYASLALEIKYLSMYLGAACHWIRSGAHINIIGSKLEEMIDKAKIYELDVDRDSNRIFYIIARQIKDRKDKESVYSSIGRVVREAFSDRKQIECEFLKKYFDEEKEKIGRRMSIVGYKLIDHGDIIRKALLNLFEPHLIRGE